LSCVIPIEHQVGCGYVECHDPPLSKFSTHLIGDLRDEVWRLCKDIVPQFEEQSATQEFVRALQDQVKQKNAEIEALQG
jgi:hypothetical protein